MFTVEGEPIEIAAGRASRPYNYDRSRIYQGVIGFRGPKRRGWLYDPNLFVTYGWNDESNGLGRVPNYGRGLGAVDDALVDRIVTASNAATSATKTTESITGDIIDLMRLLSADDRLDAARRAIAAGAAADYINVAMAQLQSIAPPSVSVPVAVTITPTMSTGTKIAISLGIAAAAIAATTAVIYVRRGR